MKTINASGIYYRDLNEIIKELVRSGEDIINLKNVNGQRYIGDNLSGTCLLYTSDAADE